MRKLSQFLGPKEIMLLSFALIISLTIFLQRDALGDLATLGYAGIFLIAVFGNATLILPAPVLVFVFAAGSVLPLPWLVGLLAGVGSAIGECTGYAAGYSGSNALAHTKVYARCKAMVEQYGAWAIGLLAFIPNPIFDIAGIAAGAIKMPLRTFLLATLAGKTLKTLLIAYAGSLSIDWVRHFF